jgi:hypothetical protein
MHPDRAHHRNLVVVSIAIAILVVSLMISVWHDQAQKKDAPAPAPPPTTAPPSQPQALLVTPLPPAPFQCKVVAVGGYNLPDPACTPGAALPGITKDDLCPTVNSAKVPRDVTSKSKAFVRQTYNDQNPGEIDHKVPLELGGSNGDDNLWPEDGSIPNPKDGVERHAHTLVCNGGITLQQAQVGLATNWVAFAQQIGVTLPPR